jgi:hypothetical protein
MRSRAWRCVDEMGWADGVLGTWDALVMIVVWARALVRVRVSALAAGDEDRRAGGGAAVAVSALLALVAVRPQSCVGSLACACCSCSCDVEYTDDDGDERVCARVLCVSRARPRAGGGEDDADTCDCCGEQCEETETSARHPARVGSVRGQGATGE